MEASSKDLQKITNLKVSVNYNVTKDIDSKAFIVEHESNYVENGYFK